MAAGTLCALRALGGPPDAFAQGSDCLDRGVCGEVSPLIPMQSTEAVHMGLVWKKHSQKPKILFHARFPEYTPNDMADPALVDLAIAKDAFTTAGLQFNSSEGRPPRLRSVPGAREQPVRRRFVPEAHLRRLPHAAGAEPELPTRIVANRTMERQLLFDINHPDAFKNTGKFHTSLLDEADFALNRAAFAENGFSKGMFYNTYCNARVTLSDGRVYVFGGHDMQSNNGLYKVNVFDPDTETWQPRRPPCSLENWRRDPFGRELFAQNPDAPFYDNCDPRDQQSTQPSEPSDQRYARWYPSAVPLPNNMVLVVGGFDQDNSVAPDPARVAKGRNNQSQSDTAFTATRINQVVPEVYDPRTDRNIALENARMAFPLYPQLEVVATGPGKDDWKVCTFNGEIDYGDEMIPGGARFGVGGGTPNFTKGTTWCLDVLAAMRDPNRDVPAKNHWTLVDTALEVRPYCCPTASLVETDANGRTVSHRWFMISGQRAGAQTGTVEKIEFTDAVPRWVKVGDILQPLSTTKAVLLPDGKVLIGHGVNRTPGCTVSENGVDRPCTFDEKEGHYFQMFDPDTGAVRRLATTTVSRGLHGTATLLPDATVFFAGENREALVRPDDPSFPMTTSYAGVLPAGDPDQGVPVGQVFSPPYLFRGNSPAARPVITHAPRRIHYGGHFDLRVGGRADTIGSVAILRSDHNTHRLTTGDRYVKLAFEAKGNPRDGRLRAFTPRLPAQAVPGIYMIFVLDKNGVPSEGRRVDLKTDDDDDDDHHQDDDHE